MRTVIVVLVVLLMLSLLGAHSRWEASQASDRADRQIALEAERTAYTLCLRDERFRTALIASVAGQAQGLVRTALTNARLRKAPPEEIARIRKDGAQYVKDQTLIAEKLNPEIKCKPPLDGRALEGP